MRAPPPFSKFYLRAVLTPIIRMFAGFRCGVQICCGMKLYSGWSCVSLAVGHGLSLALGPTFYTEGVTCKL